MGPVRSLLLFHLTVFVYIAASLCNSMQVMEKLKYCYHGVKNLKVKDFRRLQLQIEFKEQYINQ